MAEGVAGLTLYSRADCALCDTAEQLVAEVIEGGRWQLKKVDIDSDVALRERYAWHIPVLLRDDNNELLYWPFPPSRVRALLL